MAQQRKTLGHQCWKGGQHRGKVYRNDQLKGTSWVEFEETTITKDLRRMAIQRSATCAALCCSRFITGGTAILVLLSSNRLHQKFLPLFRFPGPFPTHLHTSTAHIRTHMYMHMPPAPTPTCLISKQRIKSYNFLGDFLLTIALPFNAPTLLCTQLAALLDNKSSRLHAHSLLQCAAFPPKVI